MKLITRDTDYAIRALCFIAGHKDKVVSVQGLTESLKIPRPFLRKILQRLNREGLLRSYKGIGGGFSLNCDSKGITLNRLIEIFQGPLRINDHRIKNGPCPVIKKCLLKNRLDRIEKKLISELQSINIKQLLKG